MKYVLAIDQSTSGTKAILLNDKGEILHRSNTSHKQYYPNLGWVEHDPIEIIDKTYETIANLLRETEALPEQIVAVGISNQRETVLIWDKATGKPVYNAIVWQCQRAADICREIELAGHGDVVRRKTGLVLSPLFPAAKVKWILDNVKGVRKRAHKGELLLGTIDAWLLWHFTGGKVHATDYSNASRTQLLNIKDLCWDEELLDIFDIPKSMMPRVMDSNAKFGYTNKGSVFGKELPITCMMGDSHAALFGQNCFDKGMTKTTYGTGSSIMMNIGIEPLELKNGLVTSIAWGMDGEVEYVLEGNITCTGATIQWLIDQLQLITDAMESEVLATSIDSTKGVYLVPAFAGLGPPYWDSDAKACIIGMTHGTGKSHVVRAALESIAYQIKDIIDIMIQESRIELKELRVDGGSTKNNFLMQFQSDMLKVPVICSAVEELSAIGAGYMAGLKMGVWTDKESLKKLRNIRKTYYPKISQQKRDNLYTGWKKAIESVLDDHSNQ